MTPLPRTGHSRSEVGGGRNGQDGGLDGAARQAVLGGNDVLGEGAGDAAAHVLGVRRDDDHVRHEVPVALWWERV